METLKKRKKKKEQTNPPFLSTAYLPAASPPLYLSRAVKVSSYHNL